MIQIIGGAGFVGSRLAQVLVNQGRQFEIFDKSIDGPGYCDVTEPSTLASLPYGGDVVINLAAEHRDDVQPASLYDQVNVQGARNVCNYCRERNIQQIVFTSSVAVFGFADEGTDESGPLRPFNDYGRTKMEAESVYRDWLMEDIGSRSLIIIRPTVIFGEQNRGNVYNLLSQVASGRFLMFGPGTNRKSLAYVQNVAEFLAFSLQFGPGEHLYNYVDKPDLDMNTLIAKARLELFGLNNVGPRLPSWLGILTGIGFDVVALISRRKLSITSMRVKKFMASTSFNSASPDSGFIAPVTLDDALRRTLRYEFLEEHNRDKVYFSE